MMTPERSDTFSIGLYEFYEAICGSEMLFEELLEDEWLWLSTL